MKIKELLNSFFTSSKMAGLLLIATTVVSLIIANSTIGIDYVGFWETRVLGNNMHFWINDVLMSFFFLLVGLELKREIYIGELSNIKKATLPLFAALGGMIIPAIFYLTLNHSSGYSSGFGIVMATDIAFAIGVLSLLGKRVPNSLKIFLIALAIFDDVGAIIIIALFYSSELILTNVLIALGIFLLLLFLSKKKINNIIPYIIGGVAMWYLVYTSGIHPTIAAVLLAFAIPFDKVKSLSLSTKLEEGLHIPVYYLIIPIFALSNTAIRIVGDFSEILSQPYSIGIVVGLVVGKPIGIFLFSWFGVKIKLCRLPNDLRLKHILSVGFLGGIGFTMSIFITLLAFDQIDIQNNAKISILIASTTAAIISLIKLSITLKKPKLDEDKKLT